MSINGHDLREMPIVTPEAKSSDKETLELVRALGDLLIRMNKVLMLLAEQQSEIVDRLRARD